jgi:hypothetical protein
LDEHTEECRYGEEFFPAMGCGGKPGLLALSAEDIEWIATVLRRSCDQRLDLFDGDFRLEVAGNIWHLQHRGNYPWQGKISFKLKGYG